VFNLDGTGGKTQAGIDAGRKVNVAHLAAMVRVADRPAP